MSRKITLLDRAAADIKSARLILSQNENDELFTDIAAYHAQQGIEKLVKFVLASNGVKYNPTHDMAVLHEQLENAEIESFPWLEENIDVLNSYATKTRYGSDIVATKKKIVRLLNYAEKTLPKLQPSSAHDDSVKPDCLIKPS